MTLAMIVLLLLTGTRAHRVTNTQELAGFDYAEGGIVRIEASCFDWFPSQLLTPEDFARGAQGRPQPITRESGQYGTYRLVVDLPAGQVYGLSAYSATYAQRLWVNGVLLSQVGVPGVDAASTTPKTSHYAVFFTATTEPTEIVIQRSEFVHAHGGQLYPQFLGMQASIKAMVDRGALRGAMLSGFMLLAGLFLLGFFFVSRRARFGWFALACLAIMERTLFTDQKLIMVLFPDLGWQASHRIESAGTLSFGLCVLLYLVQMSPRRLPRALTWAGVGFSGLGFGLLLLAPSTVYTKPIPFLQLVYVGLLLWAFVVLARAVWKSEARRNTESWLVLGGAAGLGALVVADVVRYSFTGQYDDLNLTQAGMGVFVFANMLALALGFSRAEWSLAATQQEVAELARREQKRRAFLADVGHEMRTPLTVMSAYAQYTRAQLEEGTADDDTRDNLNTISREAQRLSVLVGAVLSDAAPAADAAAQPPGTEPGRQQDWEGRQQLAVGELFAQVAKLCQPVLSERDNRLEAAAPAGCPPVMVSEDQILQVLVNLCVNANRHTEGSAIRLLARTETAENAAAAANGGKAAAAGDAASDGAVRNAGVVGEAANGREAENAAASGDAGNASDARDMVAICVEDNGDGIRPDLLPYIFERGVSGDGSAGLGLAICRDVVESHGGTITVESAPGEGTRITFTLPAAGPDQSSAARPDQLAAAGHEPPTGATGGPGKPEEPGRPADPAGPNHPDQPEHHEHQEVSA
jgi:signal transduction histidine kinase